MRISRLLIAVALLVFVAAAGAVLFRKPLLHRGLEWIAADLEIPVDALTVADLDHRRLVLTGLSLGPGQSLSARRVELSFTLPDLLAGQMPSIRIQDLGLTLDLVRRPTLLADLNAAYRRVRARFATDTGFAEVPSVEVASGRLVLLSDAAVADMTFRADTRPSQTAWLTVAAALSDGRLETPGATLTDIAGPFLLSLDPDRRAAFTSTVSIGTVRLDTGPALSFGLNTDIDARLTAGWTALELSAALRSPDAGFAIDAETTLSNILSRPEGTLSLSGTLDASRDAWNAYAPLRGSSGALSVSFDAALKPNPDKSALAATDIQPAGLSGTGRLASDALFVPGFGRISSDAVSFDLTAGERTANLTIGQGSIISIQPSDGPKAALPVAFASNLDGTFTLDPSRTRLEITAPSTTDTEAWRAHLQPRIDVASNNGLKAALDGDATVTTSNGLQSIAADGTARFSASGVSAKAGNTTAEYIQTILLTTFSINDSNFDLELSSIGTLGIDAFSTSDVTLASPVLFDLATGSISGRDIGSDEARYSATLDVESREPVRMTFLAEEAADRLVTATPGSARFGFSTVPGDCADASLAVDETRLDADGVSVALADTRLTLSYGCPEGGSSVSAEIGTLRHLDEQPLLAPVAVQANLTKRTTAFALDGAVTLLDGTTLFDVAGNVSKDGTSGEVVLSRSAPLVFSADSPPPAGIVPSLGVLKRVRGAVDGTVVYRWDDVSASNIANLTIRDLGFRLGAASVQDLDLSLALDPAWPPATSGSQALSIGRIDAGTALEDIQIAYAVPPARPPRLRLDGFDARFLGGSLRLDPFIVNPDEPDVQTVLHVSGVDMTALAKLTQLKGLNATGRLDGRIPIHAKAGKITIRDGRLDAQAPGTLSFASPRAEQLLRGQGEQVAQMLLALKDFRYETLGIDLDKTAQDDLTLKLSVLGNNPDVLDGYPFRINLNLTSQIAPVLDAIATALRMSRQTLRRIWTRQ